MSDSIVFIMVFLYWQSKTLCWGNAFPNCCILGSKGGAVMRALAFPQCGPGSNPGVDAIYGLSLLLVLSLAPSFLRVLRCSPLLKNLHFQDQESGRRRTTLWMCYLQIIIYLLFSEKKKRRRTNLLAVTRGSTATIKHRWPTLILPTIQDYFSEHSLDLFALNTDYFWFTENMLTFLKW